MPTAVLLAGPNGAGKTTFASLYLRDEAKPALFLNADEIARTLPGDAAFDAARDIQAGRLLLERLGEAVAQRRDFIVETTLSSRLYARRITAWREAGYRITLVYLRLPAATASLARVRRRVEHGGHDIAREDILRRFDRSLLLLDELYKPLVDAWWVVDSREGDFLLAEWSEQ